MPPKRKETGMGFVERLENYAIRMQKFRITPRVISDLSRRSHFLKPGMKVGNFKNYDYSKRVKFI
jgi:hypothetical protein